MVVTDDGDELARLRRALAQRTGQLEAVQRIATALSSQTELDALLQQTLDSCLTAVGANAGSILLFEPDDELLHFRYVVGEAAPILMGKTLEPSKGVAGEVFRTGQPKVTEDPTQDTSFHRGIDQMTKFETRNMVTVPLKSIEGAPVGVMQVLNKDDGGPFDEYDVDTLSILASQAASAIENARLYEAAQLAQVVKLMGDISHDIKNMITPVSVCAQTLEMMFHSFYDAFDDSLARVPEPARDQLADAAEPLRDFYPEAIRMFLDGSDQVQARVREIADCVKGIISEPNFEPVVIHDVVEAVAAALRLVAERAGLTIDLSGLDRGLPPVLLDQKQLYNAIYNLINNAIPETPEGGVISVHTRCDQDPEWFDGAEHLVLEVADTGRGMPTHVRDKLFTADAVSTKAGGSGLGTQIVANVVAAHGGHIKVWSEPGQGSRFTLRLPMARQPEPAAA